MATKKMYRVPFHPYFYLDKLLNVDNVKCIIIDKSIILLIKIQKITMKIQIKVSHDIYDISYLLYKKKSD